mgnify:CR=1 FL=1
MAVVELQHLIWMMKQVTFKGSRCTVVPLQDLPCPTDTERNPTKVHAHVKNGNDEIPTRPKTR